MPKLKIRKLGGQRVGRTFAADAAQDFGKPVLCIHSKGHAYLTNTAGASQCIHCGHRWS